MRKIYATVAVMLLIVSVVIMPACNKPEPGGNSGAGNTGAGSGSGTGSGSGGGGTPSSPSISTIVCGNTTISGTVQSGQYFSGTVTLPYTGGNGLAYPSGNPITLPDGDMTLTLNAGTLANGAGQLNFNLTGTSFASSSMSFNISFGGQSCTLSIPLTPASSCGVSSHDGVNGVVCLGNWLLNSMSPSKRAQLAVPLTLANAQRWSASHCGLSCRNGLAIDSLLTKQEDAALRIIYHATSLAPAEGYDEYYTSWAAEAYLAQTIPGYTQSVHTIAFVGTPSLTGKFILQYGGHNYTQSLTYNQGLLVSFTPLYHAIEPVTSFTVFGDNYNNPLNAEMNAMRTILAALTPAEKNTAKLPTNISGILMSPGNSANSYPAVKQGIGYNNLGTAAQSAILTAIQAMLNDLNSSDQGHFYNVYFNEAPSIYLSYSGNQAGTQGNAASFMNTAGDYLRIDGAGIWIEVLCKPGEANPSQLSYHIVMRDRNRDYAGL